MNSEKLESALEERLYSIREEQQEKYDEADEDENVRIDRIDLTEYSTDEIDEAINSIDFEQIISDVSDRFDYFIWDKESPIDGIEAEIFHENLNILDDGEVFCVEDNVKGEVPVVQTFDPDSYGKQPLSETEAKSKAQERIESKTRRVALSNSLSKVEDELTENNE